MCMTSGERRSLKQIFLNTIVVMGVTMGTGTFKPEKNLEFFRLKSPGTHR